MKIFKMIWKGARGWFITTVCLLVLVLTVSLVLTQNLFLSNLLSNAFGGPERVLISGDPSQYQYFTPDEECSGKEKTLELANALNEEICSEGMVLLKNTDGALPLDTASEKKISVFGKNSVNLIVGGTGSGGADTSGAPTIYNSLTAAGFEYNADLKAFYEDNSKSGKGRPDNPGMNGTSLTSFDTGETPWSSYSQVSASFSAHNSAALIVLSRIGGEGFDLPRKSTIEHYLRLDQNEKDLIAGVCASGFGKVIIIINSAAPMELGFIKDTAGIDAALWIGYTGYSGIGALGKVLSGSVNPSGRLVDIYTRDFTLDPTWQNFGNNLIVGENNQTAGNVYVLGVNKTKTDYSYVYYEEGIYMGYRYYETRGSADEGWYANNVVFPFGYGLSYTGFTWEVKEVSHDDGDTLDGNDKIEITVEVTNNGDRSGKDVVQLYYTPPYKGGIEKSHAVLGAFAKTGEIKAGGTGEVTLTFNARDMASYDYDGSNASDPDYRGYILESGGYQIKLMKNSHDIASGGDGELVYNYTVASDVKYTTDDVTGAEIVNLFEDLSTEMKSNTKVGIMSRDGFDETFPTAGTEKAASKNSSYFSDLRYKKDDSADKPWYVHESNMPAQTAKKLSFKETTVKLYEVRGLEFDDGGEGEAKWNELLDQITVAEMSQLIGTGNFNTVQLEGIAKPRTIDPDGPAGFTIFMEVSSTPTVYGTCFYASECVIAATWNTDIAYRMGKMVGNEGLWGNVRGDGRPYSGWYAPAMNIHRSPFSGRNWEYYSEDPLLSGKMAARVVKGAGEKGVYTYLKHFALNDQETNREGILTWADEQTIREIYLKPFEYAIKEGGATAVMSSFNRIGKVWAGGSYTLLTSLLRDEWGFKGTVITDFNTNPNYMPADQMIRAGGDLNLCQDIQPSKDYSATQVTAMRNATRNILYTVSRSNAMNGSGEGVEWGYSVPGWVFFVIWVDVAIVAALALWGFFAIKAAKRKVSV